MGEANVAETPTSLDGAFTVNLGLRGNYLQVGGVGVTGVGWSRGVHGESQDGPGVYAESTNGATSVQVVNHHSSGQAVLATNGTTGVGVHGVALGGGTEPDSTGVWGEGQKSGVQGSAKNGGIGVSGIAHSGSYGDPRIQNAPGNAGVYGKAETGGTADAGIAGWTNSGNGVIGTAANGTGVFGFAGSGGSTWPNAKVSTGVYGESNSNSNTSKGVWGHAKEGVGVYCTSASGLSLQVVGKAKFSRAGKASVPAGKKYVDVTVPGGIGSSTVLLATMQTYRAGVGIAAARPNYPSNGKARIYLTKVGSTSASTQVGWQAIEHG